MKSKFWQKLAVGALAVIMSLAVFACTTDDDFGGGGGGGGGGYGNLDDFFNDFFDDWGGSGSGNQHTQTDWSETYGEIGNKSDYINATAGQTFNPEWGAHYYEAEYAVLGSARVGLNSSTSGGIFVEYIDQGVELYLDVYSTVDCTALFGMSLACDSGNKLTTDLFAITYTDESGNESTLEIDDYYFTAGGWVSFKEQSIGEMSLKSGKNTIKVVSFGGFNLDYFTLTPQLSDVKGKPSDSFTHTPKTEWESVFGSYAIKEYLRAENVTEGFDPTWGAYKYEAERANLFGGIEAKTSNRFASGYATVGSVSTAMIDVVINSLADCEVLIKAAAVTANTYKSTAISSLMKIGLMGGESIVSSDGMIATNGLDKQPVENSLGTVKLNKGRNILRIEPLVHDAFELDYIALLPIKANIVGNPDYDPNAGYVVPFDEWGTVYGKYDKRDYVSGKTNAFNPEGGAHIYEAEDGELGEGLKIESKANASGGKQVAGYDADSHTITFTIESSCEYTALISLGYTSAPDFAQHLTADSFIKITYGEGKTVKCNDSRVTAGDWNGNSTYVESYIGEITLVKGINVVTLDCFNMKYPNTICLDYMLLSPKQEDASGYTVSYDFNGGEGDPIEPIKRKAGSTFTVAYGTGIKKLGFMFGGWDDGNKIYQGGEQYVMTNASVTFTAVWINADLRKVSFELDGGNGTVKDETHYAGESFNLPDGDVFTKTGYTFGGWTDGRNCYGGGTVMEMPNSDITLTAIWIPVRDNWNSVYGAADSNKDYRKATATDGVFDYNVGRGTHLFEGEDLNRGAGLSVEDGKVNASGNKQLAGFSDAARTFSLTVNASRRGPVLLTLGYTGNPGMNTSRPASYYFTVRNGSHILDCTGTAVIAGDWSNDIYVELRLGVIYLNEGLNTIEFSFEHLPFSDCIALDYVLLTADVSLYEQKVTLTYDLNGGKGNIPPVSMYAGEKFYLADGSEITYDGHYFAGWTDGKTTYEGGALFTMPSENVKLTAVWEVSGMHTVTYDADGGLGSVPAESHVAGDEFNLSTGASLTKAGYTLRGWLSGGASYALGETVSMPNSDITFKALWIANKDNWNEVYGEEEDYRYYTVQKPAAGEFDFDSAIGTQLYEAEDGILGAFSVENKGNASGGKQIGGFGDYERVLTYKINAARSGTAIVSLRYTGHPDFGKDSVGGTPIEGGLLASKYVTVKNGKFTLDTAGVELAVGNWNGDGNNGVFVEVRIGVIYLNEGLNTIEFIFDHFAWPSCITLDFMSLAPEKSDVGTKHAVSFNLDEGNGEVTGVAASYAAGAKFTVPSANGIVKEGYKFLNWNDGEDDYMPGDLYTMPDRAVTFTAVWEENHKCSSACDICGKCTDTECDDDACKAKCPLHYTVKFELDDDVEGSIEGFDKKFDTNATFNIPSGSHLVKEGYVFLCWTDGESDYYAGSSYTVTKDVTFTAKWIEESEPEPEKYALEFELDGGEGEFNAIAESLVEGAKFRLPSGDKLYKVVNGEYYAFDYWEYNGEHYQAGDEFTMPAHEVTFTAVWSKTWDKLYGKTNSYYNNDNVNEFTKDYISGKEYAFNPEHGEYIYEAEDAQSTLGTDNRGSGGKVLNGFDANEKTVTFTVYSARDYTALLSIAVTGQPGFGTRNMTEYLTITNNANGYNLDCSATTGVFGGNWGASPILFAENAIGEIKLVAGKNTIVVKVKNTIFGDNDCIQMDYMLLSPKKFDVSSAAREMRTVSYDLGGANGTISPETYPEDKIITVAGLGGITYEGYLFDGYTVGSARYEVGDVIIVGKSDITLTAVWKKDPRPDWTATYGNPDKETYVDGGNNSFVPARGAYIYEAEDAELGGGLSVESGKVNASGNKQVGGFTTATRVVTFKVYSQYAYRALISLGYTTSPSFSSTTFADRFMTIKNGDEEVYCASTYLNAGNWTGSGVYVESYIGEINLSVGLNTIVFEMKNLSDPNNLCLDYMLLMPKLTDVSAQSKYTVTYNLNEGNGSVDDEDHFEGEFFTVASGAELTRAGHYFAGWSYNGQTYLGGEKLIMPKEAVTFTAQWEKSNEYAVNYNLNGGSGAENTVAMSGSHFNLPSAEEVTRNGYTLGGWVYDGTYYKAGAEFTMPEDEVTFDAVWLANADNWNSVFGAENLEKNYTVVENANDVNVANVEHEFAYDPTNGTHIYEAEASYRDSRLNVEGETGNVVTNKPNASGKHQLAEFKKDVRTFSFKINAAKSGTALLTIAYTGNPGCAAWSTPASDYISVTNGDFALNCDGVVLKEANWSGEGVYVECRLGVIYLNEGANTILFTYENWDWPIAIAMDYILLTPEAEGEETAQVNAPVIPQETAYIKED
ncbi:MAG: InlB B-repeat-containing protein [Clostridiales bacterium]|nr:InlB B-repeat-containing protein [Clostridiales bacterium]